jgi:CRP-like cAMP-binding protein
MLASASGRTEEELRFLDSAVANNFLFSCLSPEQRHAVFQLFERRIMRMGEVVIRQGELGETFYVVESGIYDVYVQHPSSSTSSNGVGPMLTPELVHTYMTQPGQIASFGELALLYSKERAAMVVVRSEGAVWSLQRQVFRQAIQRLELLGGMGTAELSEKEMRSVVRVLRSVEVLKCLSMSQVCSP